MQSLYDNIRTSKALNKSYTHYPSKQRSISIHKTLTDKPNYKICIISLKKLKSASKTFVSGQNKKRKTHKKIYTNMRDYFSTLNADKIPNDVESYLHNEFFGSPMKNSVQKSIWKDNNESMEIVQLKNSSIHISKVFNSIVIEHTPLKALKPIDGYLYCEESKKTLKTTNKIDLLMCELDDAIKKSDLNVKVRSKLIKSLDHMKKTLTQKNTPSVVTHMKQTGMKWPAHINRN